MKQIKQRLLMTGLFISVVTLGMSSAASAHVVVKPAEVLTAGFQTFSVGVPNEKDIATISVKVLIPEGMEHLSPTTKAGWQIDVEKEGEGEEAVVKSIMWSGNTVEPGFRDDLTFSGKVPANVTDLQWKAYQTYADGTVVAWDRGDKEKVENAGPFSVTRVVTETADTKRLKQTEQMLSDAKTTAERALYVGVAGVIVGLGGVYVASRKDN